MGNDSLGLRLQVPATFSVLWFPSWFWVQNLQECHAAPCGSVLSACPFSRDCRGRALYPLRVSGTCGLPMAPLPQQACLGAGVQRNREEKHTEISPLCECQGSPLSLPRLDVRTPPGHLSGPPCHLRSVSGCLKTRWGYCFAGTFNSVLLPQVTYHCILF